MKLLPRHLRYLVELKKVGFYVSVFDNYILFERPGNKVVIEQEYLPSHRKRYRIQIVEGTFETSKHTKYANTLLSALQFLVDRYCPQAKNTLDKFLG